MTSGFLSAELSATCNALGYYDGNTYYTDTYCKETVKDLIRYLRRDDEEFQIRRHLGSAKILQTDLIPIVVHHSDDEELFDVVLRLMVNLTTPTLILYRDEIPTEKTARNYYLQIISQLQAYKEAFADEKFWDVMAKRLSKLLQIDYIERDEDVSKMMERILILTRNVLHVPADPSLEKRPDNDASVHDQVLWALHLSGIVDIFLYIASTDNEQQFYMHILEIVSLMLREQNPSSLASAAVERSIEEKERDDAELLAIRQSESIEKRKKIQKYAGSRHSRFGGTYVIQNMKSISENDIIFHKSLDKALHLNFDAEKSKQKTPKNRMALQYTSGERRSAFSIRLFLKEFCIEFLNGAYNPLMRKVKENLIRNVAQPNDESYYFWAMKFFMEFNRKYKFQVKLVSETMSKQTFHFVQTQLETWHEMMVTDKKKIPIWSRRMHLAVKAYQELLFTLMVMSKSTDYGVKESARVIMSNIFYVVEYRELVVMLLIFYNEMRFSKEYLKDVIETAHIFLKMLEHFSSKNRNMYVQKKAKSRAKKRDKKAAKKSAPMPTVDLEALWDEIGPQLSAVLQSQMEIPNDIVPFDAASDLDMDQQKVEAMKKIQVLLKQDQIAEAVGLLRAAREVWPENDCFGSPDIPPEEEFLAMKEVFMADLGQSTNGSAQQPEDNEEEESNESDDEEDEQAASLVIHEQSFNFSDFVKRFASARIVQAVCQLLANFERNSEYTNHCVVKLLHRIAWDCKVPAVLFQASVFRTFQRIFTSTNPAHKELAKFAVYVIRCFSEITKINRKIFMELLFWKDSKDAYEIEHGYGSHKTQTHSSKNVWTEEQEDELRRLYAEWERDKPEPDPVDFIMKNLIRQDRSRRSICKKLKEMYLLVGNQGKSSRVHVPKEFSEEEIRELTQLYSEFSEAVDPMACIMGRISVRRPKKQIINKLIELGLVHDRKQLYKKRGGKSKETEESESESEEETSWYNQRPKTAAQQSVPHPKSMQVSNALRRVIDSDLMKALEWLLSCVKDTVEDIGDDCEDVAVLPLSETSVLAMENTVFLDLLEKLGIKKPTDQEAYWRIPGTWKADDFNLRITVIEDALEGRFVADETAADIDNSGIQTESGRNTPVSQPKKIKKKPKKKQKVRRELIKFTPAVTARALRSVIDTGKREAVDWLLISLKDSLEDVETSREDVALVPLSEVAATAMDDPLFVNLLDKLSLKKPSQQETYWHIPGDWNSGDYKVRIKIIEDGLEGHFNVADSVPESFASQSERKQKKNTTKKQKAVKPPKKDYSDSSGHSSESESHSENEDSEKENSSSNQQTELMHTSSLQTKKKQKHVIQDSSSDDDHVSPHAVPQETVDSDSENENRLNNSTTSKVRNKKGNVKKRRIVRVDSSSDEELVQQTVHEAESNFETEVKTDVQSNNFSRSIVSNAKDSEKRKRTLIDSSSDEETKSQELELISNNKNDSSVSKSNNYADFTLSNNKDSSKRKRLLVESSSDEEILPSNFQMSTIESRNSNNSSHNKLKGNKKKKVIVDLSSDEEVSQNGSLLTVESRNTQVVMDLNSDGEHGIIPIEKYSVHNIDDNSETDSVRIPKKRSVLRIDSSSDDE